MKIGVSFLIHAVVLIVFTLCFFLVKLFMGFGSWVGFVFVDVSLVVCFVISIFASFGKEDIYNFPIINVGLSYVVVQFVVFLIASIVGIFLPWIILVPNLIVCIILLGATVIFTILTLVTRKTVEHIDKTTKEVTEANLLLRTDVKDMAEICEDQTLKTELNKLHELIRYSDPVTNSKTKKLEKEIASELENLRALVEAGKYEDGLVLTENVADMVRNRNKVCKMTKK